MAERRPSTSGVSRQQRTTQPLTAEQKLKLSSAVQKEVDLRKRIQYAAVSTNIMKSLVHKPVAVPEAMPRQPIITFAPHPTGVLDPPSTADLETADEVHGWELGVNIKADIMSRDICRTNGKRRRIGEEPSNLDAVLTQATQEFPSISFQEYPTSYFTTAVEITLMDIFIVAVGFRKRKGGTLPMIEKVAVRGISETVPVGIDACHYTSLYGLFKKITYVAKAAAIHYEGCATPTTAISDFIAWVDSYSDLFTKPSAYTGKLLDTSSTDGLHPPWIREYKSTQGRMFEAHHGD
eukprot:m.38610 g.38610  ORF g.38610 m.38610 type:complete len:293 (-) comp17965_c0_seq1:79-957(-)